MNFVCYDFPTQVVDGVLWHELASDINVTMDHGRSTSASPRRRVVATYPELEYIVYDTGVPVEERAPGAGINIPGTPHPSVSRKLAFHKKCLEVALNSRFNAWTRPTAEKCETSRQSGQRTITSDHHAKIGIAGGSHCNGAPTEQQEQISLGEKNLLQAPNQQQMFLFREERNAAAANEAGGGGGSSCDERERRLSSAGSAAGTPRPGSSSGRGSSSRPKIGHIEPHVDNHSVITVIAMLGRPGVDFEGGANLFHPDVDRSFTTRWRKEEVVGVELKQGDMVVFRGEELRHSITDVTSGKRVILQAEFSRV